MEISRADLMMGYVESYYRESLFYTAQNNAKGEELDIICLLYTSDSADD